MTPNQRQHTTHTNQVVAALLQKTRAYTIAIDYVVGLGLGQAKRYLNPTKTQELLSLKTDHTQPPGIIDGRWV